jgi:uncharacterized membrane protein
MGKGALKLNNGIRGIMELLDIIIWIVKFLVLIVIIVNIFLYLDYLRDLTDPVPYDGEDLEEEAELLTERYNLDIEDARLMAKYGEVE